MQFAPFACFADYDGLGMGRHLRDVIVFKRHDDFAGKIDDAADSVPGSYDPIAAPRLQRSQIIVNAGNDRGAIVADNALAGESVCRNKFALELFAPEHVFAVGPDRLLQIVEHEGQATTVPIDRKTLSADRYQEKTVSQTLAGIVTRRRYRPAIHADNLPFFAYEPRRDGNASVDQPIVNKRHRYRTPNIGIAEFRVLLNPKMIRIAFQDTIIYKR